MTSRYLLADTHFHSTADKTRRSLQSSVNRATVADKITLHFCETTNCPEETYQQEIGNAPLSIGQAAGARTELPSAAPSGRGDWQARAQKRKQRKLFPLVFHLPHPSHCDEKRDEQWTKVRVSSGCRSLARHIVGRIVKARTLEPCFARLLHASESTTPPPLLQLLVSYRFPFPAPPTTSASKKKKKLTMRMRPNTDSGLSTSHTEGPLSSISP